MPCSAKPHPAVTGSWGCTAPVGTDTAFKFVLLTLVRAFFHLCPERRELQFFEFFKIMLGYITLSTSVSWVDNL